MSSIDMTNQTALLQMVQTEMWAIRKENEAAVESIRLEAMDRLCEERSKARKLKYELQAALALSNERETELSKCRRLCTDLEHRLNSVKDYVPSTAQESIDTSRRPLPSSYPGLLETGSNGNSNSRNNRKKEIQLYVNSGLREHLRYILDMLPGVLSQAGEDICLGLPQNPTSTFDPEVSQSFFENAKHIVETEVSRRVQQAQSIEDPSLKRFKAELEQSRKQVEQAEGEISVLREELRGSKAELGRQKSLNRLRKAAHEKRVSKSRTDGNVLEEGHGRDTRESETNIGGDGNENRTPDRMCKETGVKSGGASSVDAEAPTTNVVEKLYASRDPLVKRLYPSRAPLVSPLPSSSSDLNRRKVMEVPLHDMDGQDKENWWSRDGHVNGVKQGLSANGYAGWDERQSGRRSMKAMDKLPSNKMAARAAADIVTPSPNDQRIACGGDFPSPHDDVALVPEEGPVMPTGFSLDWSLDSLVQEGQAGSR